MVLDLPLDPCFTVADTRLVDAAHAAVAPERGPLVYCVESADNPGLPLDHLVVNPDADLRTPGASELSRLTAIPLAGGIRPARTGGGGAGRRREIRSCPDSA